ncbi:hypothetical protein [Gordonia rubripertincta]|uniref:SGNH hydrolase-type esterase domain-containing protein n=1 Tax=Gordonia rubripertincta TaxID=36822 RepID=A0ABT4MY98_GORRU|nr:hypothetical protein [Gordonia rubripertincta]MCZ4551799.1 hypothetical protein [Gordonia rubripertincta]
MCVGTWRTEKEGAELDSIINNACYDDNAGFLSLRSIYEQNANRGRPGREVFIGGSDNFHPNDNGHAAITQRIADNVRLVDPDAPKD